MCVMHGALVLCARACAATRGRGKEQHDFLFQTLKYSIVRLCRGDTTSEVVLVLPEVSIVRLRLVRWHFIRAATESDNT